MATQQELLNQAAEIRDAELEGENTATRVGTMLIDIIEHLGQFMTNAELETALQQVSNGLVQWLSGYAQINSDSGLLNFNHSWFVPLATMGSDFDESPDEYTPVQGDLFYREQSGYQIHIKKSSGSEGFPAKLGVVYFNKRTGKSYKWNGSSMVELGTDAVHPHIIDYYSTPPFADIAIGQSFFYTSQGGTRRLAVKTGTNSTYAFDPDTDSIYCFKDIGKTMIWDSGSRSWQQVGGGGDITIINDLMTGGGNVALSAEMGKKLLMLIQQIYTSLGAAAFWGTKPEIDWESVGFTMYNITRSLSAHANAGSAAAKVAEGDSYTEEITFDEGYCRLAIVVTMGGVDISSTAVNGNVITIAEVTGAIVITVTEQATHTVTFQGTNCSLVSSTPSLTNVENGGSITLQLAVTNGYELPSTVSYGNGQTAPVVNGQVTISNIQSNITVIATAVSITEFFENGLRYVIKTLNTNVGVTSKDGFTEIGTANKTDAYTGDIVIPATVTHDGALYNVKEVGTCAFANCANVTRITIQGSLNLQKRAFSACGATSFDFGNGEIYLFPFTGSDTSYIFDSMPNIKSLVFPDNVIVNGYNPQAVLQSCPQLKLVKFGTGWKRSTSYSLNNLANDCTLDYADCNLLDGNTFDAKIGTIVLRHTGGVVAKGGRISTQTIYVPDDLVAAYQADSSWAGITIKPLTEYTEPIIS